MSAPAFVLVSTWDREFRAALREHYPGGKAAPFGKKLAWCIFETGRVRGWVGLGEPAFKLAARRRIGIANARPLPRTVNCFIYRLTSEGPTRASAILRAWHPVAAHDWERRYGWAPEHWETMVDAAKVASVVPGACFRRAGYRCLGFTTGRTATRAPGDNQRAKRVWINTSPKLVFYRGPLARVAVEVAA